MLSIEKLDKLLSKNGFTINKIYLFNGICKYIKILSINDASMFFLSIPSKYKIKSNEKNSYTIEYINLDSHKNIVEDYTGEPDKLHLESMYNEVDINDACQGENMEKTLEKSYNRPITLKDINREDIKDINNLFRQINRIKFCVYNIEYKICIEYKEYIIFINAENDIECIIINNYSGKECYNMYIIIDLKMFYKNVNIISVNIRKVHEGIHKVLNKNQILHTKTFNVLLNHEQDVNSVLTSLNNKKVEYEQTILHLYNMLEKLIDTEKKIIEKLIEHEERYKNTNRVYNDIEKTRMLTKYTTELDEVNNTKQDIIKNILSLKSKKEDMFLFVDKLLFDNNVMLDAIIKNIEKAKKYTLK